MQKILLFLFHFIVSISLAFSQKVNLQYENSIPQAVYAAEKLKGAVALQTYRVAGGEEKKQEAVNHLENALGFWDEVVSITRPIYKDMPLTHYSEEDDSRRFHWEKLRPEVAQDVEIAKNATANPGK